MLIESDLPSMAEREIDEKGTFVRHWDFNQEDDNYELN